MLCLSVYHFNSERLVGEAGLEPAEPNGNGFTARRNCLYPTRPFYLVPQKYGTRFFTMKD